MTKYIDISEHQSSSLCCCTKTNEKCRQKLATKMYLRLLAGLLDNLLLLGAALEFVMKRSWFGFIFGLVWFGFINNIIYFSIFIVWGCRVQTRMHAHTVQKGEIVVELLLNCRVVVVELLLIVISCWFQKKRNDNISSRSNRDHGLVGFVGFVGGGGCGFTVRIVFRDWKCMEIDKKEYRSK